MHYPFYFHIISFVSQNKHRGLRSTKRSRRHIDLHESEQHQLSILSFDIISTPASVAPDKFIIQIRPIRSRTRNIIRGARQIPRSIFAGARIQKHGLAGCRVLRGFRRGSRFLRLSRTRAHQRGSALFAEKARIREAQPTYARRHGWLGRPAETSNRA